MIKVASGMEAFVSAEAVAQLEAKCGYAGANSVDGTDAVAMEVSGVEDGNVYLTKEAAEHLMYSLWNSGVALPAEALAELGVKA